jgi:hypothetical protein
MRRAAVRLALGSALAMMAASSPVFAHLSLEPPGPALPASLAVHALNLETWPPIHDEAVFPIKVAFVGTSTPSVALADAIEATRRAIETWNAVACTTARMEFVGHQASLESLESPDVVPIFFASSVPGFVPTERTIAELRWPDNLWNNYSVRLNDLGVRWDTRPHPFQRLLAGADEPTIVDLQAVLTHELGHLLGLDHITRNRAASMYGEYLRDGGQRTLSAVDKLALCAMHPAEGPDECTGDRDCAPGARCISHALGVVCDKELGEPGDYCGWDLLYCPEVCHIDSPATATGYCSAACSSHADCPEDFHCVHGEGPAPQSRCLITAQAMDPRTCAIASLLMTSTPTPPLWLLGCLWAVWVSRPRRQGNSIVRKTDS